MWDRIVYMSPTETTSRSVSPFSKETMAPMGKRHITLGWKSDISQSRLRTGET